MMEESTRESNESVEKKDQNFNLEDNEVDNDQAEGGLILSHHPYSMYGRLNSQFLNTSVGTLTFLGKDMQLKTGSGILISSDIVLTAAHNIFNRIENWENQQFKFYIGAYEAMKKYHQLESWRYPEEFKACQPKEILKYDYAIMKLNQPIQSNCCLPLSLGCRECLMFDFQKQVRERLSTPFPFINNIKLPFKLPKNPLEKAIKLIEKSNQPLEVERRTQCKSFLVVRQLCLLRYLGNDGQDAVPPRFQQSNLESVDLRDTRANANLSNFDLSYKKLQETHKPQSVLQQISQIDLTKNIKLKWLGCTNNRLVRGWLFVDENVDEMMSLNFWNQQSASCRIELRYEGQGQAIREKAIRLADRLGQEYSEVGNSENNCAFCFLVWL